MGVGWPVQVVLVGRIPVGRLHAPGVRFMFVRRVAADKVNTPPAKFRFAFPGFDRRFNCLQESLIENKQQLVALETNLQQLPKSGSGTTIGMIVTLIVVVVGLIGFRRLPGDTGGELFILGLFY